MINFQTKRPEYGSAYIEFYLGSLEPTGVYPNMIINREELPDKGRCEAIYTKVKCGDVVFINKMFNSKVNYRRNNNIYVVGIISGWVEK